MNLLDWSLLVLTVLSAGLGTLWLLFLGVAAVEKLRHQRWESRLPKRW